MIYMVLPAWLLSLLPIIGGGVNAGLSALSVGRMNRYNDPKAQLARLNAAGLPFAAFQAGQAGNQSSLPDLSGIGTGIGQIGASQIQARELDLLLEKIRGEGFGADTKEAEAEMKGFERDIAREEWQAGMFKPHTGGGRSRAYLGKHHEYIVKEANKFIAQHEERIKELDKIVKEDLYNDGTLSETARAQLGNLLLAGEAGNFNLEQAKLKSAASTELLERLMKDGLSVWESLLIVVMNALSGGVSAGGARIGF